MVYESNQILRYHAYLHVFYSLKLSAQNHTIDSLLSVLKNQPEDSNRIKTLNNLGNTLNTIGDGKSSQIYLKEGITISKKIKYDAQLAKLYGNLGNAYIYDNKLDEALKSYLASQEMAKKLHLEKGKRCFIFRYWLHLSKKRKLPFGS